MQPSPTAETSGPRVPSLRFCIASSIGSQGEPSDPHREPTASATKRADVQRATVVGSLRSPSFVGGDMNDRAQSRTRAPGRSWCRRGTLDTSPFARGPTRRAVYLAGSHLWNNLHDGMGPGKPCADEPERMDFGEYLDFLDERGHNFIRLWRWEQFRSYTAAADYHLCMSPPPWARTGSGEATDGKPKFDLEMFDEEFFDRLRGRVTAGDRGMYVDVMLFEGWGIHLSTAPMHIEGHPFHASNNVNASRSGRSSTTRSYRSTPACRSSRSATSGRSWTRFTISPTSCMRSRTSRPGAGRSISSSRDTSGRTRCPSGATRPSGSTG